MPWLFPIHSPHSKASPSRRVSCICRLLWKKASWTSGRWSPISTVWFWSTEVYVMGRPTFRAKSGRPWWTSSTWLRWCLETIATMQFCTWSLQQTVQKNSTVKLRRVMRLLAKQGKKTVFCKRPTWVTRTGAVSTIPSTLTAKSSWLSSKFIASLAESVAQLSTKSSWSKKSSFLAKRATWSAMAKKRSPRLSTYLLGSISRRARWRRFSSTIHLAKGVSSRQASRRKATAKPSPTPSNAPLKRGGNRFITRKAFQPQSSSPSKLTRSKTWLSSSLFVCAQSRTVCIWS